MKKYNVTEFAKKLNISRRTMYRYIEKGFIVPKISNLTGCRYFTDEDVVKYSIEEIEECQENIRK